MKLNRILLVLLLLILFIPAYAFIKWFVQDKKELRVLVVDKTAPKSTLQEHKSLFWVLNHERYVNGKREAYDLRKDYYGFFPVKSKKTKEYRVKSIRLSGLDSLVQHNDVFYCADAYGVFYSDWYKGVGNVENSTLIYGGFNQNDYYLLQKFLQNKKMVIAEYDLFAYPTNPLIRYKTQDLLGVRYSGWTGKYFKQLAEDVGEVPTWLINRYKKQYRKSWPYSSAGIILLNKNHVIVLESNVHLHQPLPLVKPISNFAAQYNLPGEVAFTGWFEVVENVGKNNVFASIQLKTNTFGDEVLSKAKIPTEFPILLGNLNDNPYLYIAADFTDNPIAYSTHRFDGIMKWKHLFYSKDADDKKKFFWEFYFPLIRGLFEDYYQNI